MTKSYAKVLTKNDTGETGGHQAGIVVPKANQELLSFFPLLEPEEFNPDSWLYCTDSDGEVWKMRYIYYNGKTHTPPKSTRNEFRITHMTKFFAKWGAKAGDSVVFIKANNDNSFEINIKSENTVHEVLIEYNNKPIVLKGWSRVY